MISKLFPVLFLLLFLSGCQYSAWKKVQEQNTVFSYENFLKKYPTGTYSDEARDAIEFLDWEDAGKQKSAAAFQKFIEKYPRSKFVGVATRLKEEADLRAAEKENTLGAYQEFIRKYPKSKLKKRAQKKMGELSWEAARKKNSVTGYREFLDTGKESMFKAEAEKRLEQLQLEKYEIASFKEAEQENTLDSYRLFLEIYPRGVYAKKAISLLIPLLPESMKERVEDLLSLNPLSRARGVLTLAKFDPDRLLLITPLLMNSLADTTPIHPKGRVWEKSTTIGGEIQKIFYSLGKRAVPSLNFALLLGGYLNSRYSDEVRIRIVETLSMIGDRDAILPLIDLLQLKEIAYNVKLEAIKVLLVDFKESGAENISASLLSGFLHHKERNVRWETVEKLREIAHPITIEPLIFSLDDSDLDVQMAKIRLLGERRDRRAVGQLISIMESGKKRGARNIAADSLTKIGDRMAMRPFLNVLKSSAHLTLRRKAIKGLVLLYDFQSDADITGELIPFSKDPDQFIRHKARAVLTSAGVNLEPEQ